MKKLSLLVVIFAGIFLSVAHAEDEKNDPKIIYKKKTSVDFSDAIVEGQVQNPEGIYVVTPPEKKFGSLLKLRPNFHRELMRDALLMK